MLCVQQYNRSAYNELRDFIVETYHDSRDEFENRLEQLMASQGIGEERALDELIARGCEMMLKDSKAPQLLAERNADLYGKLAARIREWAQAIRNAIRKLMGGVKPHSAEAKRLMAVEAFANEVQQLWDEGLVGAVENMQAQKSPADREAVQYSVKEISGRKFVWIDADILQNKPQGETDAYYVEQYLLNKIARDGNFLAQLPESGAKVYAEEKGRTPRSAHGLADEYVRSKYSQWVMSNRGQIFKAKMKAAGVLDELISIATNREWQKTRHTANKDAPYGTYYYNTIFAFPVSDSANKLANRANAYDCKLVILNASNGEKYLYDIVSVKKNTSLTNDISRWLAQKNQATLSTGVSSNTIPQSMPSVNQNSLRDDEYMTAVRNGDMETAQRMVDEAAKAAGYDRKYFHGARKGGGFTVFRDWQYFTENEDYAKRYMDRDKPESLYTVHVKAERMFDTRKARDRRAYEKYRMEQGLGGLQSDGLPDWTDGYSLSDIIDEEDLPYDGYSAAPSFCGEYNITKAVGFYITFAARQKYHCKLLVCNITFTHRNRNVLFGQYLPFSKYVTHYDTSKLKVSFFIKRK